MKIIAKIRSEFPEKFGIPRQSGLAQTHATVIFEPEYRTADAVRGLEDFSHIWLLWEFSEAKRETWSPTVRPPRLGGNERLGVFATRSPFRPNPIGLSCVALEGIGYEEPNAPVLRVSGADLMDGTPIYDMKPYLPYADCKPLATGGFAAEAPGRLTVELPAGLGAKIPAETMAALRDVLAQDPRPPYQNDPERVYGLTFAGLEVRFVVRGGALYVMEIS